MSLKNNIDEWSNIPTNYDLPMTHLKITSEFCTIYVKPDIIEQMNFLVFFYLDALLQSPFLCYPSDEVLTVALLFIVITPQTGKYLDTILIDVWNLELVGLYCLMVQRAIHRNFIHTCTFPGGAHLKMARTTGSRLILDVSLLANELVSCPDSQANVSGVER